MTIAQNVVADKLISDLPKKNNDNSIIIKDAEEIRALLNKIFKKRSLLTVTIGGNESCYGSTILEINSDEQYLVIDELNPLDGHEQLEEGSKLKINTQQEGALVRFTAEVIAIGGNDDAAYYKIPVPKKIEFHQRRNTYRVYVGINETIPVSLKNEEEVVISAELRDISLGGVSLRVKEVSHAPLQKGDLIPTCVITASNQRKIKASLNICHIERMRETGMLRVGAQFVSMSKFDLRELENFIAAMEREMIKKLKRVND